MQLNMLQFEQSSLCRSLAWKPVKDKLATQGLFLFLLSIRRTNPCQRLSQNEIDTNVAFVEHTFCLMKHLLNYPTEIFGNSIAYLCKRWFCVGRLAQCVALCRFAHSYRPRGMHHVNLPKVISIDFCMKTSMKTSMKFVPPRCEMNRFRLWLLSRILKPWFPLSNANI